MTDLTERLAREYEVCNKATPGPWKYGQAARGNPADGPDHVEVGSRRGVIADLDLAPQAALDAQFISEARTGYPLALRALQAVLGLEDEPIDNNMMGYEIEQANGYNEALRDVREAIQEAHGASMRY